MQDINLIREQPDVVRKALSDRQLEASPVDEALRLDEQRRYVHLGLLYCPTGTLSTLF